MSPMSVLTEVTVAPSLRSAAATVRASAPLSTRTTYVPDPVVEDAVDAEDVVGDCRAAVAVLAPRAVVARATAPVKATKRDRRIRLLLCRGGPEGSRTIRSP